MGKLFDTKSRRSFQKAALANFEASATGLFNEFVRKYYWKKAEWSFAFSNDVNTIEVGDDLVSIATAYDVMKYKLTRKQYFDYMVQLVTEDRPYPTVASYVHHTIRKIR